MRNMRLRSGRRTRRALLLNAPIVIHLILTPVISKSSKLELYALRGVCLKRIDVAMTMDHIQLMGK